MQEETIKRIETAFYFKRESILYLKYCECKSAILAATLWEFQTLS